MRFRLTTEKIFQLENLGILRKNLTVIYSIGRTGRGGALRFGIEAVNDGKVLSFTGS